MIAVTSRYGDEAPESESESESGACAVFPQAPSVSSNAASAARSTRQLRGTMKRQMREEVAARAQHRLLERPAITPELRVELTLGLPELALHDRAPGRLGVNAVHLGRVEA